MPQLEFFLVAESVSVDQSTNRLSLFNIIEELRGVILPKEVNLPRGSLPQLIIASSWNVDEKEFGNKYTVEFRLHRPGNNQHEDMGKLQFFGERRKQRILQVVLGCPITTGDMRFEVLLDGEHKASHLVTVHAQVEAKPILGNGAEHVEKN